MYDETRKQILDWLNRSDQASVVTLTHMKGILVKILTPGLKPVYFFFPFPFF